MLFRSAYVGLLSVLEQNPGADVKSLLAATNLENDADPESLPPAPDEEPPTASSPRQDDDLETFKL